VSIQKKEKTAAQIAKELRRSESEIKQALNELALSGDAAGVSYLKQYFEASAPNDASAIEVSATPGDAVNNLAKQASGTQSDIDPTERLNQSQQKSLDAAINAAATMGDATSGLYDQVVQKLGGKRQERDEPLAEQIAQRVFDEENKALGSMFTGLLDYVKEYDPCKGTPLENLTGASRIDINELIRINRQ
jgi:hypothetical protein